MPRISALDDIEGVYVVEPDVHEDSRGLFVETYRRSWIPQGREMIQGNRADRQADAIVGLHYHLHQSDYWCIPFGTARVVLHDLRQGSPTDGITWSVDLGAQPDDTHRHTGIYIPPGVAHGFSALSDCTVTYLVDGYYNPADELGVAWDDPDVAADWGVVTPILSDRDLGNPRRKELPADRQPHAALRA